LPFETRRKIAGCSIGESHRRSDAAAGFRISIAERAAAARFRRYSASKAAPAGAARAADDLIESSICVSRGQES
jgi:hypothetical protein